MVWALREQRMGRNYAQLLAWSCMAGVFWIAGATVEGDARLTLWALALVLDFGGPLVNFWLPRLGQTPMSEWTLRGGVIAVAALALLGIIAPAVNPLTLAIAATLVLAGLVAVDARARFSPAGSPSPGSRI